MKTVILTLIKIYQAALRPVLPPRCRFYPACSDFAAEAVSKHGALRGSCLALSRLARCHPFNSGGYDPVTNHG
jgi:hypothetical protein